MPIIRYRGPASLYRWLRSNFLQRYAISHSTYRRYDLETWQPDWWTTVYRWRGATYGWKPHLFASAIHWSLYIEGGRVPPTLARKELYRQTPSGRSVRVWSEPSPGHVSYSHRLLHARAGRLGPLQRRWLLEQMHDLAPAVQVVIDQAFGAEVRG